MQDLNHNALTSFRSLNAFMRDTEEQRQLFARLINQASASIEAALDRQLGLEAYTEYHPANGELLFQTRHYPIVSVDYIKLAGQLLPPGAYSISEQGALGGILKSDGWTCARGRLDDPATARSDIEIRYSAGYVLPKDATPERPCTLPADIEGLCLLMVIAAHKEQKDRPQKWHDTIQRHKRKRGAERNDYGKMD